MKNLKPILPKKFILKNGILSWDESMANFDLIRIEIPGRYHAFLQELRPPAGIQKKEAPIADYVMKVKKSWTWSEELPVQVISEIETAVIPEPETEKAVITPVKTVKKKRVYKKKNG